MWDDAIKQLAGANDARGNVFWPDVHRETEQAMLRQLFATAVARNVLSGDHVEQFLLEVCDAGSGTGRDITTVIILRPGRSHTQLVDHG